MSPPPAPATHTQIKNTANRITEIKYKIISPYFNCSTAN